jgi:hypothetical protein
MAVLICHTEACENAGIPIVLDLPDPPGLVLCGPCGAPIADIAPNADQAAAGGDDPWPF